MSARLLAIGTIVGGLTILATGYLLFMTGPFQAFLVYALTAGTATGVIREPQALWAVGLGAMSYSGLIALMIGLASGSSHVGPLTGVKLGAVVGFLLWFTADFMFLGISNVGNLTSTLVDPFLELVPGALAGGVIAVVLERGTGRLHARASAQ